MQILPHFFCISQKKAVHLRQMAQNKENTKNYGDRKQSYSAVQYRNLYCA